MAGQERARLAISALGDEIARRWKERSHDESVFPDIATDALQQSKLLSDVSGQDLVELGLLDEHLPAQYYSSFGQPPLALYRGHEFYIEALFWLDSTTAVHQHSFSGAFAVLEGSSVHSRYGFEQHERVTSRVLLGDARFRECELLERGSVRPIVAGNSFIHALFHLDHPSVSVVIRTSWEADYSPQYTYLRPGLAIDPFYEPEPMMTQIRLLTATREGYGMDAFLRASRTLLETADYWLTYRALLLTHKDLEDNPDAWQELESVATKRHGERIAYLRPALEELHRQKKITDMRKQVKEADHRYLLALLLNVPGREEIDQLVRARYPNDDAQELIVRWLKEIAAQQQLGFDSDPLALALLKHALRDATFDDACTSVREELPNAETPDSRLQQLWEGIRHAAPLRPLFARPA